MANLSGTPPHFSFNFYFGFCRLLSTNGRMEFDLTQGLNEVMARVFFPRTSNQAKYSRFFFTVGSFLVATPLCLVCFIAMYINVHKENAEKKKRYKLFRIFSE